MSNGGTEETEDTDYDELRKKLGKALPDGARLIEINDLSPGEEEQKAAASGAEEKEAEAAAQPGAKEAEVPPGEKVAAYLLDEEPTGESNWIKWMLMNGATEEDLVNIHGRNPGSVRICAQELEKDGYRKRPPKPPKGGASLPAVTKTGQRSIRAFAGGSPPEVLIDSISLPLDGPQARIFENGLKAGASLIIIGIRAAQELSAIAIQQAKPIMDMAKTMREGEAIAAKGAASEAAQEAAMKVSGVFAPHLSSLESAIAEIRTSGGQDPMQAMLVRTIEPMVQQMMKMFMPGVQYGQQGEDGWKVEQE